MKNLCDAAKSSEPKEQEPTVDPVPKWMAPDYGESVTGDVQLLHGLLIIKSKSIQTFCLLCAHRGGTSCTSGGGGGQGRRGGGGGRGQGGGGPTSQRGGTITAALHHRRRTCVYSTPIHRPGQERSECIFHTLNSHPFIITIIDKLSIDALVNNKIMIYNVY